PVHPAAPNRHGRKALWPRWRASGDRGESPAQAATDRHAPCSPTGAEPAAERPAAVRILVALSQSRTEPKGRRRFPPFDAPRVSPGVGPSQVPPSVLIEAVRQETRAERAGRGTHSGHRRPQDAHPRFGCPRIARIISRTFGVDVDKNIVYRVLAKH